ncbi:CCRG-2 family RiPP [Prochlorococcus sp. MIT 1201]|uniref:CCRG-2 family RiPP n=1 Tax=Prochlorococcus sp. MIT 1201 TaxID=3082535 RepID=UPI0039A725D8
MTNNELTIEELQGIAGGFDPGDCVSTLTSQVGSRFGMTRRDWEISSTLIDGGEGHDLQ